MLFYTHVAFAVLMGIIVSDYVSVGNKFIFFTLILLFSPLADIDKANSKVGKNFGFISKLINFFFGHRNFFHSFTFVAIIYFLFNFFGGKMISFPFLIAYSSHLFLDAMTPHGIRPFYPLKYKWRAGIKTSGFLEKLILITLLALIVLKLI
jgi:inner membrane protein